MLEQLAHRFINYIYWRGLRIRHSQFVRSRVNGTIVNRSDTQVWIPKPGLATCDSHSRTRFFNYVKVQHGERNTMSSSHAYEYKLTDKCCYGDALFQKNDQFAEPSLWIHGSDNGLLTNSPARLAHQTNQSVQQQGGRRGLGDMGG